MGLYSFYVKKEAGMLNLLNSKWQKVAEEAQRRINKVIADFEKFFEVIEGSTVDYDENDEEIEIPFYVVRNDHEMNTAEWRAEISGSPEEGYEIQYFDYTENERGLGDHADSLEQAIEVAKSGILERMVPDFEDARQHEILDFFLENLALPEGFDVDDIHFSVTGSQYFTVKRRINENKTIRFRVTIRDHEIKESTLEHGDLDIAIFVSKKWTIEEVAWAFQKIEEKIAQKASKALEPIED
jgi:hypothetical protein